MIGHEFGLEVVQRVSDLDEERTLEVLEEAVSARVVEETPRTIARYRFSHALVRETLYGELRTLERVRLHRRELRGAAREHARGRDAGRTPRRGDKRALAYVLDATPWAGWGPDNLARSRARFTVSSDIRSTRAAPGR